MLKVSTKYVLSTFHMVYGGDQGWHPRGSAHADPRPRFYAFFRDFQNWPYADPRADARIRVVRADPRHPRGPRYPRADPRRRFWA